MDIRTKIRGINSQRRSYNKRRDFSRRNTHRVMISTSIRSFLSCPYVLLLIHVTPSGTTITNSPPLSLGDDRRHAHPHPNPDCGLPGMPDLSHSLFSFTWALVKAIRVMVLCWSWWILWSDNNKQKIVIMTVWTRVEEKRILGIGWWSSKGFSENGMHTHKDTPSDCLICDRLWMVIVLRDTASNPQPWINNNYAMTSSGTSSCVELFDDE